MRLHALVTTTLTLLLIAASVSAAPVPDDLTWLRRECGDGALGAQAKGRILLTELSTGRTERVGSGQMPEFSPDSARLAWIDGDKAVGRLRKGDPTIHTIVSGLNPVGGVHWIGPTEVVVLRKDNRWMRVTLDGRQTPVPELDRLGRVGREADVKLRDDGVWVLISATSWATSDGKSGKVPGTCSVSLSPDGRSATSLNPGHKIANISPVGPGGMKAEMRWVYSGAPKDKGFDNHRWSSNDPRYIVVVDEGSDQLAVMKLGTTTAVRMGEKGAEYGDFTVGSGEGATWLGEGSSLRPMARSGPVAWPVVAEGLLFAWSHATAANRVPSAGGGGDLLCSFRGQGMARLGCHHELMPGAGRYLADGEALRAWSDWSPGSTGLSLEALITPCSVERGREATVLAVSRGDQALLRIVQTGDQLHGDLDLGGDVPARLALGRSPAGRAVHVLLTLSPDGSRVHAVAHVNGQAVRPRTFPGSVTHWRPTSLSVGDGDWIGGVECLGLWNRALDREQASVQYRAAAPRLAGRSAPPRAQVRATLLAVSAIPQAGNYPNALVLHHYRIERVLSGRLSEQQVLVAHWAILNGKVIPAILELKPGTTRDLWLEPFDAHPQLADIQRSEPDDAALLILPLYHDVADVR